MNIQNNNQIDIEGEATVLHTEEGAEGLAGVFAGIDGPEAAPEGAAAAEQQTNMTQAEEIQLAMFTAGQILAMKYPSLAAVFSLDKCKEVANQIAPLLEYYGIKFSLTGIFGLWANAALAVVGLGTEIRAAVVADMAAAVQKATEEAGKA